MTESSRPRRFSRAYWRRVIVANVAAAVAVTVFYSGISLRTPPRQMLEAFAISMLFSTIIGPMLGIVMPRVGRAAACRFSFPFDWVVLLATMVAIALAGSFTAILILAAIGYLHGAGIVATWMAGSVKASIAITLTFGIFLTVVEGMRRQLDDARMALRTKERDEAEARRLAAEAQLASIESRVQPHFLFNTLNSIAALVHHDPAGAERMISQSIAWAYQPGATPISEETPLQDSATAIRTLEALTLQTPKIAGTVLRYGLLYGPGTGSDAPNGPITLHVDVAARATLLAAETAATGIFNIVDDGGPISNAKAKSVLAWTGENANSALWPLASAVSEPDEPRVAAPIASAQPDPSAARARSAG